MKKLVFATIAMFGVLALSAASASAQATGQTSTPPAAVNDQPRNTSTDKAPTARPQQSQISTPTSAQQPRPVTTNAPSGTVGQQQTTPKPAQNNSSRGSEQ